MNLNQHSLPVSPPPTLISQRTTIMTIAVIRLLVISAVRNSPDCSFAIAATTTTTATTTPIRHQLDYLSRVPPIDAPLSR
jgi:hypothetical protein